MKLRTLSVGAIYCILNTAFATPVFERPLDNGMDNAIVDAFVDFEKKIGLDYNISSLEMDDEKCNLRTKKPSN